MTRTITSAFTDYPDGTMRPVTLLDFDGNKYATVRHEDGSEDSVKFGYIYSDPETRRHLGRIHWHVLAGGKRHNYKRRQRKTTYRLHYSEGHDAQRPAYEGLTFRSLQSALAYAAPKAAGHGAEVFVFATVRAHDVSRFNCRQYVVTPQGEAFELRRRRHQKFVYGYGRR